MLAHLSAQMSEYDVTVFEFYTEHRIRQSFFYYADNFNSFILVSHEILQNLVAFLEIFAILVCTKLKLMSTRGIEMEKEFIEKCRQRLIEERNEILESFSGQDEQMKKIVDNIEAGDEADRASERIDSTLLNSLSEASNRRLTQINNALERIKQGKFGICRECGKEIPQGRLEAIPYAALCIACQTKADRMNR